MIGKEYGKRTTSMVAFVFALLLFASGSAIAMPRPISKVGSFGKTIVTKTERGARFAGRESFHAVRFGADESVHAARFAVNKSKTASTGFVSHVRGR